MRLPNTLLLSLATWLIIGSCGNQHNSDIVTRKPDALPVNKDKLYTLLDDSLVYAFINEINMIGDNSVVLEDILIDETKQGLTGYFSFSKPGQKKSKMDFIEVYHMIELAPEDTLYYEEQEKMYQYKLWDLERLGHKEKALDYQYWELNNPVFDCNKFKDDGFGCFVSVGAPFFNKEKNCAIIYIDYTCHATLCNGTLYRFDLIDGKWKVVDQQTIKMS